MPYPSFDDLTRSQFKQALKHADPTIFDDVLRFLEDDPTTFGSGYLREDVWRYIRRYPLDERHMSRLEHVALNALHRPMSREFNDMCRAMTEIARPDFWSQVAEYLTSDVPQIQFRAWCLHGYAGGVAAGEKRRLECGHFRYEIWWRYHDSFISQWFRGYSPQDLLTLIYDAQYWRDGLIAQRPINPEDLPIVYYKPEYDQEFAALDMSAVVVERLLPALEEFLLGRDFGYFSNKPHIAWLYTVYLLQQMNDARVVPLLVRFLERRFPHTHYQSESYSRSKLHRATLKVLRYYATPEALAVVALHQEADSFYEADFYAKKENGWVLSYP